MSGTEGREDRQAEGEGGAHDATPPSGGAKAAPGDDGAPGSPTPVAEPAADAAKLPRKKRRWRRRIAWAAVVLLVLAVVFRIALIFVIPAVLAAVARGYGLTATYERLDLTLLSVDAEIWHLVLAPEEGGDPLVDAEYARLDVDVLRLLTGRIVVRRLEADGVDLLLDRDSEGGFPVVRKLLAAARKPTAEPVEESPPPEPEDASEEPGKIDLTLPAEVCSVRLQLAHLRIRDATVSPPRESRIDLNIRVSDLGSDDRPARFLLTVLSNPFLDKLQAEGTLGGKGNDLEADFFLLLRGLRLEEMRPYLELAGLQPAAREVSFDLRGKLTTKDSAACKGAIEAKLVVEGLQGRADEEVFCSLDRVAVDARSIGTTMAHVPEVSIGPGRLHVSRSRTGAFRIAGLEIGAASPKRTEVAASPPPPAGPAESPPPAQERKAPAVATAESAAAQAGPGAPEKPKGYRAVLDLLTLKDLAIEFHDDAVRPPGDLSIRLEQLLVKNVVRDPAEPAAAMEFDLSATAPGIVEAIGVNGRAIPFADRKTVDASVHASGIVARDLAPQLAGFGVEPIWKSGTLSLAVRAALETKDGRPAAEVAVEKLSLRDGEEILGLEALRLSGISPDAAASRLSVASVEIVGPSFVARRTPAGAIEALGFRIGPAPRRASGAPPPPPEEPPAAQPSAASPAPAPERSAFEVDLPKLLVRGVRLHFVDEAVSPAADISVSDAGVEITELLARIGAGDAPPPAKLRAWLAAPGLVSEVAATGALVVSTTVPSLNVQVGAKGITAAALASYLRPAGLEPGLRDGSLEVRIEAGARVAAPAVEATLSVSGARFLDGEEELLGLDSLSIRGARLDPTGVHVDTVEVVKPRAAACRTADGAIRVAGIRRPAATAAASPAPSDEGQPGPAPAAPASPPAEPSTPPGSPPPPPPPPMEATLKTLRLTGAQLTWKDEFRQPGLDTALTVDSELQNLSLRPDGEPARFTVTARAEGLLDEAKVTGAIEGTLKNLKAGLEAQARGIRPEPLFAYLPPNLHSSLRDGRFRGKIEAAWAAHAEGGMEASLSVAEVELRDGDGEPPLLTVDAARLATGRIDPAGGIVSIKEISLAGFGLEARRAEDGAFECLGIRVVPPARPAEPVAAAAPAPVAPTPVPPPAAPPAGAAPPVPAERSLRAKAPAITLEKLDIGVRRIGLRDDARAGSAPVAIADVRLTNLKPVELLGEDTDSNAPVELLLEGKVQPIVGRFEVQATIEPFVADPRIVLEVAAEGIRAAGITEVVPELAKLVDGSKLTDGRFHAAVVELGLFARRRGPAEFDLSREFGVTVQMKDVALRNGPEGPVLAGLDGLEILPIRVDPVTGAIRVGTIDIATPRGRVTREKEGIRVLDILVRLPEAPAAPDGTPATPPSPAAAAPAETAPAPAAPAVAASAAAPVGGPPPEMRIDRVLVSGIDFLVEDRSVDPPLMLPIAELDVDVRGLTNLALREPLPVRFDVLVGGGKVPLRKPPSQVALVGAVTDTAALVTGSGLPEEGQLEDRPVFQEVELRGNVIVSPRLTGRIHFHVTGFELLALKGNAAAAGVTIAGGTFDKTTDVEFLADGLADVSTSMSMADLSVSEPPDGPIFRYLGLPAPLGTVLFAIRDDEGNVGIPMGLSLDTEGASGPEIARAVATTLGALIGKAFLASPFRVAGGITDVVVGGGEEAAKQESIALSFQPGDTAPSAADRAVLEGLAARIRDGEPLVLTIQHELGGGDIERARRLANPSPEECLELIAGLRRERAALRSEREAASARARVALGANLGASAEEAMSELRRLDTAVGQIEAAIDGLYERLRPAAAAWAEKLTREASLAIARERLAAVERLLASGIPDMARRVRLRRPRFSAASGTEGGMVTITVDQRPDR